MNIFHSPHVGQSESALAVTLLDHGLASLHEDWQLNQPMPPFSRVYYILAGAGFVESAAGCMALEAGRAYLLPPGLTLKSGQAHGMRQLFFHIACRTIDGYDIFAGSGQMLSLPLLQSPQALALAYQSESPMDAAWMEQQLRADVYRFLALAGLDGRLEAHRSPFLRQVFSCVEEALSSRLTIGDVARALGLSESSLTKRFRSEFGMPLGRYMDDMLFQALIRLLADSTLSIGRIAEQLGFCDQFYLTRFFRARQGMTPREYRSRLRL